MNKVNLILAAIPLTLALSTPALAERGAARSDHKPIHQLMQQTTRRINQGEAKGRLTRDEAHLLRRQQREIRRLARVFRQDGYLTKVEKRVLKNRTHTLKQRIRLLSRNNAVRNQYRNRQKLHDRRFDQSRRYDYRWGRDGYRFGWPLRYDDNRHSYRWRGDSDRFDWPQHKHNHRWFSRW